MAHKDTFGPFQTKVDLLPNKDKVGLTFEQKIIFCLKWSRWAQMAKNI